MIKRYCDIIIIFCLNIAVAFLNQLNYSWIDIFNSYDDYCNIVLSQYHFIFYLQYCVWKWLVLWHPCWIQPVVLKTCYLWKIESKLRFGNKNSLAPETGHNILPGGRQIFIHIGQSKCWFFGYLGRNNKLAKK